MRGSLSSDLSALETSAAEAAATEAAEAAAAAAAETAAAAAAESAEVAAATTGAAALETGVLGYALVNAEVMGAMSAAQTASLVAFLEAAAASTAGAGLAVAAAGAAAYFFVDAVGSAMENTVRMHAREKAQAAGAARVQAITRLHKTDPVRYGMYLANPAYRKRVLDNITAHSDTHTDRKRTDDTTWGIWVCSPWYKS
jgi:hypothetical protein